jgi:hypothetical protein
MAASGLHARPCAASRVAGHPPTTTGMGTQRTAVSTQLPAVQVARLRHSGRGSVPYSHTRPSRGQAGVDGTSVGQRFAPPPGPGVPPLPPKLPDAPPLPRPPVPVTPPLPTGPVPPVVPPALRPPVPDAAAPAPPVPTAPPEPALVPVPPVPTVAPPLPLMPPPPNGLVDDPHATVIATIVASTAGTNGSCRGPRMHLRFA